MPGSPDIAGPPGKSKEKNTSLPQNPDTVAFSESPYQPENPQ